MRSLESEHGALMLVGILGCPGVPQTDRGMGASPI
ncbi:MAG: hypothetical protein JWP03_4123 [Phycisphaerales bacterium]|jgi:hypothetical protein|nr:hypothetical protein [Phycisphaerales bacterium]